MGIKMIGILGLIIINISPIFPIIDWFYYGIKSIPNVNMILGVIIGLICLSLNMVLTNTKNYVILASNCITLTLQFIFVYIYYR